MAKREGWGRSALEVAAVIAGIAAIAAASRLFVGAISTVIPGEVYRSRQLEPAKLEAEASRLSLRAILNLRGERPDEAWYREERALSKRLGIEHHDLRFSTERLPSRARFRELVEALARLPRPLLLHCSAGVDRSGFASGVAVLAAGGDLAAARNELGPISGLLSRSELPRVLDQYEGWLLARREATTPAALRRFAADGYIPAFYAAQLAVVGALPDFVAGEATPLRVRVANASPEAWRFSAAGDRGVHLAIRVRSLDPARPFAHESRGATPARVLAPHESIELDAALPPLPAPGAYEIWLDLVDESRAFFSDMGSSPLVFRVDAQPRGAPEVSSF
jgi:hypothetical protein